MPLTRTCLASENAYQKKGGLMCLAVLAEGCADHIRTKYVPSYWKSSTIFHVLKCAFLHVCLLNFLFVRMLSSVLQTVCQSLSDSNQVVRSAGLFALGQLSEHLQVSNHRSHRGVYSVIVSLLLSQTENPFFKRFDIRIYNIQWCVFSQPDVSKYCAELMPLLLNYLSSLSQAKIGHVTKAFYALENFMENLGKLIYAVFF